MEAVGAESAGAGAVGAETAGAETAGAETAGVVAFGVAKVVLAIDEGGCFRAKNKIAATTMIAAAVAKRRISVFEFDLVTCFGGDDGGVTFAVVTIGSMAGTVAAGADGCGFGGAVRSLPRRGILSRASLGGTTTVGAFSDGIGLGGTGSGPPCGTALCGTGVGEVGLG